MELLEQSVLKGVQVGKQGQTTGQLGQSVERVRVERQWQTTKWRQRYRRGDERLEKKRWVECDCFGGVLGLDDAWQAGQRCWCWVWVDLGRQGCLPVEVDARGGREPMLAGLAGLIDAWP